MNLLKTKYYILFSGSTIYSLFCEDISELSFSFVIQHVICWAAMRLGAGQSYVTLHTVPSRRGSVQCAGAYKSETGVADGHLGSATVQPA